MHLTLNQAAALRMIGGSKVTMSNRGYGAWRINGASPSVVGRLVSIGLARWPKGPFGEQTCELTEAGREALASLPE